MQYFKLNRGPKLSLDISISSRYKYVCLATVGENNGQSGLSIMKFFWDSDRDLYASYVYENRSMIVCAIVLAVYYE